MATLVTVPVLMSSGASSDGEQVAAVVVPETISASGLEADVDIDELFDAGADLDHVPQPDVEEEGVAIAAEAVLAAPQSLAASTTGSDAAALADEVPDSVVESPASVTEAVTSTTISEAPVTVAPSTTAAPVETTAAPATTQVPAPESTTTAPAPEPVVESPQAAEPEVAAPETEAAPNQPTAEQWAALRQCEASGNYSIVSSNGLYHGAYQFYQPTWDGLAAQVGRSDLVGLPPSQAAPADQDALALLLWQQRGNQPWPHCGVHLPAGP